MTSATFPSSEVDRLNRLAIDLLQLAAQLTPSGRTEPWVRSALAAAAATHRARLCLDEVTRPAAGAGLLRRPRPVIDGGAPTNRTDILDAPSPAPAPAPGDEGLHPDHPPEPVHSVADLREALFATRDALVQALPGLARSGDWKKANGALCACDALAEAIDALSAPGRRQPESGDGGDD